MAGMKTVSVVLLGLCLLVGVVYGVSVDQPDSAWQFSVDGNTQDNGQGGHLVPDNGFQYSFGQLDGGVTGNPDQLPENTFASLPEQYDPNSEGSSFGDQGYVYNARSQDNDVPYDYTNNQFSTQQDGPSSTSYAVDVPQERDSVPEYVYDASAGDAASFSTLDTQGSEGDQAVAASDVDSSLPVYAYDASAGSGDPGASLSSTLATPPSADEAVPVTGHQGPSSFYTPASDADGAFHFYDARTDEEKNATSALDEDPPSGAESFSQHQDASSDTTIASTQPVLASTKAPEGTHGCPNSYWAAHVKQWPKELKISTPVCQAFGGVNLRKNLEIVYGTTTVFQALLDTRADPYSKLLRNAVAALLNAYAKPAFTHKPAEVSKLFHAALASKTAAAAQAQKFENENSAFGDSDCK